MKIIKLTKTGGGNYTVLNIDRNNTLKKGITNGMIEMNKAFKIIWNTARVGYVVASEMQRAHGKTSRVKTVGAFALAGALALSATVTAKTITNDSISEETTTKLISGDGELNIETAGDLRQLAEALKTGKLDAIRAALGVGSNAAGSTVTLVGAAGGNQYFDDTTLNLLKTAILFKPKLAAIYEKLVHQTVSTDKKPVVADKGTQVVIGENNQTPLILGLTGADNIINVGAEFGFQPHEMGVTPFRLSGGQKRLVSIACILAMEPEVILLDEPTTALDPASVDRLTKTIESLQIAKLIVSHDYAFLKRVCGRIVTIRDAQILALE